MSEVAAKVDDIKEENLSDDEVVLKPKKVKRICSEKQLEALKKNRECNNKLRTEEAKEKKLKRAIELVEKHKVVETKAKQITKEPESDSSSDSSSEEEVVIVKKKREKIKEKPKKKKKKTIIEISDSESESGEEPEPVKKQKPLKAREMITQQNKKSLIKVHKPVEPINYFCD